MEFLAKRIRALARIVCVVSLQLGAAQAQTLEISVSSATVSRERQTNMWALDLTLTPASAATLAASARRPDLAHVEIRVKEEVVEVARIREAIRDGHVRIRFLGSDDEPRAIALMRRIIDEKAPVEVELMWMRGPD